MSTSDHEGRRNFDTSSGSIDELIKFLRSKLEPDDLAEAMMMLGGGVDPQDAGMDEPPSFRGKPLTGGTKAQDMALRKRVTDAAARQRLQAHRAFDEHRESLGLRPIRNLG
jgi:hypothetical protein